MNRQEKSVLRVITNGLCVFLLAGMVACSNDGNREQEMAEEAATAEAYDNERFYNTFSSNSYFAEWDKNGDTFLDNNEYLQGDYRNRDANQDSRVDQNEWRTSAGIYGRDTVGWADWDLDADNFLSDQEYGAGFTRSGWIEAWDSDGDKKISEREYSDGIFKQYDRNRDNSLDETEYGEFENNFKNRGGANTQAQNTGATEQQ
ncbi:EF-hand domain-containing protein [Telluribacter humicola]|uniref:hypothetical protein n=1 Tax=Telluribacter humicola TaxID=1720261 RepID=UPI001A969E6A|nr:hypothetical protein [Telluribacter humicola]